MKILALDYGTKRVGVAISDEIGILARPLSFLNAEPEKTLIQEISALVSKEGVGKVLLGLPRNMDGSYGDSAKKVQEFAGKLKPVLSIPLQLIDERLTTVQASRQLHEGGHN